jgi:cell division protein FtsL
MSAPVGPRLCLVHPPSRRPRRRFAFLAVSSLLVGIIVFGVASLQAVVSQTSFRMQGLAKKSTALQASYSELTLEVAELSAPGRIAEQAARLGLIMPDHVITITVPGPAPANSGKAPTDDMPAVLRRVIQVEP